jgi:hypothetical protein
MVSSSQPSRKAPTVDTGSNKGGLAGTVGLGTFNTNSEGNKDEWRSYILDYIPKQI